MTAPPCRLPGCNKPVLRLDQGNTRPVYCSVACAYQAAILRKRKRNAMVAEARRAARPVEPPGVCRRPGCGQQLSPPLPYGSPRVWCSRKCQDKARSRRALDTCQRPGCGAPLGKGRQRYCTTACQVASRPRRARKVAPPRSTLPPPKAQRPTAPGERICAAHGCPVRFEISQPTRVYCSKACRRRACERRRYAAKKLAAPLPPERQCAHEGCKETFRSAQPGRRFCSADCHKVTAKAAEPPAPLPSPPPPPPAAQPDCPQCGAAGALRRSGRDLYCVERCGYYLTPGQRRQAA